MRLFNIGALVCALLATPALASAQAKQGDAEITVGGSVQTTLSEFATSGNGQIILGIGYFLTHRFEIGFAPRISINAQSTPVGTLWSVDSGLTTKGLFFFGAQASRVKPYAGATLTIQSFSVPEGATLSDNLYSGALLGVKSYLNERTAIDFSGELGFRTSAPSDYQLLQMNVGFTYLF